MLEPNTAITPTSQPADPQRGLVKWTKGQSGNPSGRPAVAHEFREKCRDFMSAEGWDHLVNIALHGTGGPSSGTNKLKAIELIAGYAFGKPVAMVAAPDPDEGFAGLSIVIVREDQNAK